MSRNAAILVVSLAAGAHPAQAALACPPAPTFNVNTTADGADANATDCICAASGGLCTLRAAVMQANQTLGATIVLPASASPYVLTIPPTQSQVDSSGDLDIETSMTIRGAGSRVTAVDATAIVSRVFWLKFTTVVATIQGLSILNGRTMNDNGAGILSFGQLTLDDVRISHCSTQGTGAGGCLHQKLGSLQMTDSTLESCNAIWGAGLFLESANASIERSTISGNSVSLDGGGIFTDNPQSTLPTPTLTILNSTISGNQAHGSGGGIFNSAVFSTDLANSTVTLNQADSDFDGTGVGGGVVNQGTMGIVRTILAGNFETISGPFGSYFATGGECSGGIAGYVANILSAYDTSRCEVTGSFSLNDPKLDALRDNGGFTKTHALLGGSPALGTGFVCYDFHAAVLTTDQRGVHRPLGGACDMGAVEYDPIGDVNGDGVVNVLDVLYLINYLFADGPQPRGRANVNGDANVTVADVLYLINYLFASGTPPV